MKGKQRTTIYLPRSLYEWLRDTAHVMRRSMNSVVVDALKLMRDGTKPKERKP